MSRKLGFIALFGIALFLVMFGYLGAFGDSPEFDQTLFGKVFIGTTVLSIVVPWLYAVEKTRAEKNRKWFWLCFLFWPIAPYYLIKIRDSE